MRWIFSCCICLWFIYVMKVCIVITFLYELLTTVISYCHILLQSDCFIEIVCREYLNHTKVCHHSCWTSSNARSSEIKTSSSSLYTHLRMSAPQYCVIISGVEYPQCWLWFDELWSVTSIRRKFRIKYHRESLQRPTINAWYNQSRKTYGHSLNRSVKHASLELNIAKTAVWRILRKHLRFKLYRLQLLQALSDIDKERWLEFCFKWPT